MQIPIFPLSAVLFPHMPMALHIFEQRYRALLKDCEESGTGFGIVAIEEGFEVGSMAKPYRVGTLAKIRDIEPLADGRSNVMISGASRFRIDSLVLGRPYLRANVTLLPDERGDDQTAEALAERTAQLLRQYINIAGSEDGDLLQNLDTPPDPELLSYIVSAVLQVETAHKQELLEANSAVARLRLGLRLLRREHLLLERMLVRSDLRALVSASPN